MFKSLRIVAVAIATAMLAAVGMSATTSAAPIPGVKSGAALAESGVTQVQRRGFRRGYRRGFRRGYRRWRRPGVYFYVGPRYARPRYYGRGCGYLRRRAISTGSSYWWRRYRRCIRY